MRKRNAPISWKLFRDGCLWKAAFAEKFEFRDAGDYEAEGRVFDGAPGPLITRLSELRRYSTRLK